MGFILLVTGFWLDVHAQNKKNLDTLIRLDVIGDAHHSRYNFTDAVIPYYGVDGWTEMKFTCWLDKDRTLAPYLSLLGSWMFYMPQAHEDIRRFDWQRYAQAGVGFQWHPFKEKFSRGIRVFVMGAYRLYHQEKNADSPYSNFVQHDLHLGADYYYDDLFPEKVEKRTALTAWSNLTFRLTNFSLQDFHGGLWTGNVKYGWRKEVFGQGIFYPYLALDWTTTYPHRNRWWENYAHAGGGMRLYPLAYKKGSGRGKLNAEGLRRLHLYGEWWWEGIWFYEKPPARVKNWDLRFGIGFSTPGFLRTEDKERER